MLLTALAFKLKKLLKYQPKKTVRLALPLPRLLFERQFLLRFLKRHHRQYPLGIKKQRQAKSSATAIALCWTYLQEQPWSSPWLSVTLQVSQLFGCPLPLRQASGYKWMSWVLARAVDK
jgi:hypothetical protein